MNIEDVPFEVIQHRIMSKFRIPQKRNMHHAIYGQSGSGKSHLIRHGILPLFPMDRVLVIDVKGVDDDEIWKGYGERVAELPTYTDRARYRLDLSLQDDEQSQQQVLADTFDRVMYEGRWVLVIDEMQYTANLIGLKRGSKTEQVINLGRSRDITCIMGTQSPKWSEPALKGQASAIWFGHMINHEYASDLAKLAGEGDKLASQIKSLNPGLHQWLYFDSHDGPLFGRTVPPAAS